MFESSYDTLKKIISNKEPNQVNGKRKRKPPESFSFLHPKEAKRLNKALQLSIEEKKLKTANDKLRDNTISKKKKETPKEDVTKEQKEASPKKEIDKKLEKVRQQLNLCSLEPI